MKDISPYDCFLAAIRREIGANWKGKQKLLADKSHISVPFLSEIVNEKKNASITTQYNISKALGFSFEKLIAYGRSIIDPDDSDKNNIEQTSKHGNLYSLQTPFKPPPDSRLEAMQRYLLSIYESGDEVLISTIEANLKSFQEIAELKKTVADQKEKIEEQDNGMNNQSKKLKSLEDQLRALEKTG
jgi:transcriptional regulator with XRE-family HTH domain